MRIPMSISRFDVVARLVPFIMGGWIVLGAAPYAAGQAVVERHESESDLGGSEDRFERQEQKPPPGAFAATLEKLRFSATSSVAEILPFQTVRLQQRLENVSAELIGPLPQLYEPYLEMNAGGEKPQFGGHYVAGRVPISMIVCGMFPQRAYRRDLFLEPGRSVSLSFPLVTFQNDEKHRPRPFFERPGQVEFRTVYQFGPPDVRGNQSFRAEATIAVRVVDPQGDDRQVYEELQRHPAAAFALTGYDYEVAEEAIPVLERLLRERPASSYSDYIRLALARGLWGGDAPRSNESAHNDAGGFGAGDSGGDSFGRLSTRSGWKFQKNDYNRGLISSRRHSLLTSDFHSKLLPDLQAEYGSAHHEPVRLKQLNDKLATMSGTSRERRVRIVKLLLAINRERFPLAPVVTYHLARTLSIDEPTKAADEYVQLALRHADTYEWLYRLEIGALTAEDWLEYRLAPKH